MAKSKIDLTIVKKLVEELESSLLKADVMLANPTAENRVDWIVELNKATGLAAGILAEAGLLMGDIQHLVIGATGGASDNANQDLIKQLLGGLKGPGNVN